MDACLELAASSAVGARPRQQCQRNGNVQQRGGHAARRQGSGRVQAGHSHRDAHLTVASGAQKGSESVREDAASVSRRSMMALLLATGFVQPARADDAAGESDEDAEALMKQVLEKQPGISGNHREKTILRERELSFEVPNTWSLPEGTSTTSGTDSDGFDYTVWPGQVDPVNGLVVDEIRLLIRPTDKQSIEDFGKPESINFAQAYGMKERGFPRADVLGVNVRKDALGNVFYDWDLAIPPVKCDTAKSQFGNTGSCESESVMFVSSTVQKGYLTVMTASLSNRRQWELNGVALKRVRTTLWSADPPPPVPTDPAPLPDPTPGAGISVVVAAP